MHKVFAKLGVLLALASCDELADQESEGIALATLRGTLSLGRNVEPPSANLRVSVLWQDPLLGGVHDPGVVPSKDLDAFDPTEKPGPCGDGQPIGWRIETALLEQSVRVATAFPSRFSIDLTEPPPVAALLQYPDGSEVARALGDLVVYEDRNGNDRLDPSTFSTRSPDLILGSSQGASPWGVGQRHHYTIMYLSGDSEGGGQAGYSILTEEYDALGTSLPVFTSQRLSEALLDLTLDPTTYVQQMACTVMCKVEASTFPEDDSALLEGDLGTLLPAELEVGSTVWSKQDGDTNTLTLRRCFKEPAQSGFGSDYTMELSIIEAQGCREMTSVLVSMERAFTDADVKLPCPEFGRSTLVFPTEPPTP